MTHTRIDPMKHAPRLTLGAYDKISTKKVTDHLSEHVEKGEWVRVSEYRATPQGHKLRDFKSPSGAVWSAYEVSQRFGLDDQVVLFYPHTEPLVGLIADVSWSSTLRFIQAQRIDEDTVVVSLSGATPQDCVSVQEVCDSRGVECDLVVENPDEEAWSALQDKPGDVLVVVLDKNDERIYRAVFSKAGLSSSPESAWMTSFKASPHVQEAKRAFKIW